MFPGGGQQKPKDTQVDGYTRVVNGKVVRVNAYAKKETSSTKAAKSARKRPGRPQMAGQPGTYAGGRDIPGQKYVVPRTPPPMQMKGQPNGARQSAGKPF